MRSVERVIISTLVYSASLVVNVIFNAIFIFGLGPAPAMGVSGAGLRHGDRHVAECGIVLIYILKVHPEVHFRPSFIFVREKELMKDFRIYALPVILNELAWGTGTSAIAAIIGHMGSAAVAANSITQVTRQLAMVVTMGVANATAIILGRTIGERKEELALIYASRLVKLSALLGVGGSIVMLCVSPIARRFMTLTPQADGYLGQMMVIMALYVLCQAVDVTLIVGAFRAGGGTRIGLALDAVSLWGVCLPAGAIAAFLLKQPVWVVYLCLTCDEMLKLPFSYARYRSKKWLKNITR